MAESGAGNRHCADVATVAGMVIGGWMSGGIFDLTGSYRAAFRHRLEPAQHGDRVLAPPRPPALGCRMGLISTNGEQPLVTPKLTSRSPLTCSEQASGQVVVCRLPALATFAGAMICPLGRLASGRNRVMKTFLAHLIVGLGAALGTAPLASAAGAIRWRLSAKRPHFGALLRRPSTAAVGAGRLGPGSHSVAIWSSAR